MEVGVGVGSVLGRPFSPANIPDLSMWLDGADSSTITEVSGVVSEWSDKSGLDRHAIQSTPSLRPTYSSVDRGVVFSLHRLDFHSDVRPMLSISADFSLFMVYDAATSSGSGASLISSANGALSDSFGVMHRGGNITFGHYNGSAYTIYGSEPQAAPTGKSIVSIYNDTGYVDGVAFTGSNTPYASGTDAGSIGMRQATTSTWPFDGNIHEVVLYNRALTAAEVATVESYLQGKWG